MATIRVDDAAMSRALRKLKTLENLTREIAPELAGVEDALLKEAREQPRKKPGAFTRMATPGQRRAYWAKVRSGEAQHGPNGYVRSYALWRAWKRIPRRITADLIQIGIDNDAPHAKYVQGRQRQPFHKASGWKTDSIMARENGRMVRTQIGRAIQRAINK